MKRILLAIVLIVAATLGLFIWRGVSKTQVQPTPQTEVPKPTDFTARFEVYTNGLKRIFTASMYHNLSPDIYIDNPDPGIIYVKKSGIRWADFFKTLPMSLTKDCLVTGTKQTFCSNETKKLKFFLNDVETPTVLGLEIKPDDFLVVRYE